MRYALLLCLLSCGTKPDKPYVSPMVIRACEYAIRCAAIMEPQRGACEACLGRLDSAIVDRLHRDFGPEPPIELVPCDSVRTIVRGAYVIDKPPPKTTNGTLNACVIGLWYGPFGR